MIGAEIAQAIDRDRGDIVLFHTQRHPEQAMTTKERERGRVIS
jgi:hypothetical protein